MNIFERMKILWVIFRGHHKAGLFGSFLCIYGSLLLGVAKISNIFGGMPDISDIIFRGGGGIKPTVSGQRNAI